MEKVKDGITKNRPRGRNTIDRETAVFIKQQLSLRLNIDSMKERSKQLLEMAEKVEKEVVPSFKKKKQKLKSKRKQKFDPKDVAFDLLYQQISKIMEKEDQKEQLAEILNSYLDQKKKSKIHTLEIKKTQSDNNLKATIKKTIESQSIFKNKNKGDETEMMRLRMLRKEKRRVQSMFLFPFINQKNEEESSEDSSYKRKRGESNLSNDDAKGKKQYDFLFPFPRGDEDNPRFENRKALSVNNDVN